MVLLDLSGTQDGVHRRTQNPLEQPAVVTPRTPFQCAGDEQSKDLQMHVNQEFEFELNLTQLITK